MYMDQFPMMSLLEFWNFRDNFLKTVWLLLESKFKHLHDILHILRYLLIFFYDEKPL